MCPCTAGRRPTKLSIFNHRCCVAARRWSVRVSFALAVMANPAIFALHPTDPGQTQTSAAAPPATTANSIRPAASPRNRRRVASRKSIDEPEGGSRETAEETQRGSSLVYAVGVAVRN